MRALMEGGGGVVSEERKSDMNEAKNRFSLNDNR